MKLLKKIYQSLLHGAIILIVPAVAGLSSCDNVIYDNLDPCDEGVRLRFVYDYNMEFANAFSQVTCLTVLVYNADGTYRETRTVTDSNLLSDENWRLDIDLPEGDYKIIAYGGMACPESSYHFVETPAQGSHLSSLQVALNEDIMNKPDGTNLHKLFWGTTLDQNGPGPDTDFSKTIDVKVRQSTMGYEEYTVFMMRDTNNLRVVMAELNGDPVSGEDFNFTVIDNNTLMGWNNDVIPTLPFSYKAFVSGQGSMGVLGNGNEWNVAFAEMSFGRLDITQSPRLLITRASDGNEVVNIPLYYYFLLMKPDEYKTMPDQEFLDREHQWNMTFFLDEHWKWITVKIEVQDWVVRVNNPQLHN